MPTTMLLCHVLTILCLTVSAPQSQGECRPILCSVCLALWPRDAWRDMGSEYSTIVLKLGDAAVYLSLSFACNRKLHSLTIPFAVAVDRYLYLEVSVWRSNETGYYQVREFQDGVRVPEQAVRKVFDLLWNINCQHISSNESPCKRHPCFSIVTSVQLRPRPSVSALAPPVQTWFLS